MLNNMKYKLYSYSGFVFEKINVVRQEIAESIHHISSHSVGILVFSKRSYTLSIESTDSQTTEKINKGMRQSVD
jgi:hypothetical protein